MDVYCHPFTSGGQELPIQEAKAAGLITLVTDYSCGTDSAYEHQGGIPLAWNEYREPSTQFIKATTCPDSINENLTKVLKMPQEQKDILIKAGRDYVKDEFSVEYTVSKLISILQDLKRKKSGGIKLKEEKPTKEEKSDKNSLTKILEDVPLEDRIAVVMPQSGGDVLMINSLMKNLKKLYVFITLRKV